MRWIQGRGLCTACYAAARYIPKAKRPPKPLEPCVVCGKPDRLVRGRCQRDYAILRRREAGIEPRKVADPCRECGAKHFARGLCEEHYYAAARLAAGMTPRAPRVDCTDCGAPGAGGPVTGLCPKCYQSWYNRTKRGRDVPRPSKPKPQPRIQIGEWLERDGITVVHWPKGVPCPICDAESAQAA